jgi:glycogen(starch) synthase
MTRVLMTADAVGGVWTYACELIAALAAYDVEVTLAVMGDGPSPAQARRAAALANLDLVARPYALEWMPDAWADVDAAGGWLLELAARIAPDLVQINGYAHAALPFQAPVVVVAHSCVWTWMRAVRHREPGPEWAEYRRRVRTGLTSAEVVVAPTAAILRDVLAAYSVVTRSRVIPNACDPEAWPSDDKQSFVLSAGRLWDDAKGLVDLVACAPGLDWPIVVAGPTTAPDGSRVAATGVHALGELAPGELARWMGRASIYASPARYEPFGLSVLEAALAGCALVLGDLATLREVWGDTAIYVPPGDPDALGFALNAAIRDPLSRGTRAARAHARARCSTPDRMAAAYRALYDETIERGRARREATA